MVINERSSRFTKRFLLLGLLFVLACGTGIYVSRDSSVALTQKASFATIEPEATKIFRQVWAGNDFVLQNVAALSIRISNIDPNWGTISLVAGPNLDNATNWIVIHMVDDHWQLTKDCGAGTSMTQVIDICRDRALPKPVRRGTWTEKEFKF
jgi:hypothetical protein